MKTNKIIQIKPLGFPWETKDPFLFCVHHKDDYPAGNENLGLDSEHLKGRNIGQDFTVKDGFRMYHGSSMPGFPHHPHRGFETITITKEGTIDHSDSLGAAGRFGAGDVQWMTAGKGILHAEMFPMMHRDRENPLELFQIWLNLPKASKFVEPHFKMLWDDMIPVVTEKDLRGKTTEINVIAGGLSSESKNIQAPKPTPDSWAANPENDVAILTIKMEADATWVLPKSVSGVNRTLYFYRGEKVMVAGEEIGEYNLVELNPAEEILIENGNQTGFLLLLQGRPINEPVAKYGPFVMNTQAEIQEAFADYQRTQFGGWPWPNQEMAHAREKGRFALHADGREELK